MKTFAYIDGFNPCAQPAGGLKRAATFYTVLRKTAPAECQFPPTLSDNTGEFHKPPGW